MFCEPNPIALNTAMSMCGLANPVSVDWLGEWLVFRLPYVPLSTGQREKGAVILKSFQKHIPGCKREKGAIILKSFQKHIPGSKEVRVMDDTEFTFVGRH
ncbi:hypothetical protein FOA52_013180 [Chlamydomonas sp. UWO 241]|nr:hypothetical protein FOA52_013180 [Chlamydomonas sp. UWO 241]